VIIGLRTVSTDPVGFGARVGIVNLK
jgi:hypothetical protein